MRFLAFLSVFVTLYGLLHFYAFLKVRSAFVLAKGVSIPLACFMLFMIFTPIIVRVLERFGMEALSRTLAYIGYSWMGVLLLFVSTALLIDIYHLLCYAGTHIFHITLDRWVLSPRARFFTALTVSVVAAGYGFVEAESIRVNHVTIRSPKIPKAIERLRIVQISDTHLGQIVGERRLKKTLIKVRKAAPDILASTGDLLDGQLNDVSKVADMLGRIRAPLGKFAVMGNHEFYAGIERSLAFMKAAGFEVLRGNVHDIPGMILIAGVDDAAANRFGLSKGLSEAQLLSQIPVDRFALLLKHRPLLVRKNERHFDLQLSGHTHGGQIFPFSLIIKMLYPVDAGLLRLQDSAFLYVSRGSGTWGPPIRFFAPPEITIIDLVHGKDHE